MTEFTQDVGAAFDYALLANAAYTNNVLALDIDSTNDQFKQALKSDSTRKFTESIAGYVSDNYSVLASYSDPYSGFQAVLFLSDSGEKILACRGTEFNIESTELIADADSDLAIATHGFAVDQTLRLIEFIEGLKAQNYISESDDLAVTGHSLGGHLANVAAGLYPELFDSVHTFNGAGVGESQLVSLPNTADSILLNDYIESVTFEWPGLDNVTQVLMDDYKRIIIENHSRLFGVSENIAGRLNGIDVNQYRVEGDVVSVAPTLSHYGEAVTVFSETENIVGMAPHSMTDIVESLLIHKALQSLDSTLTSKDTTEILRASSNVGKESLESLMKEIATILQLDYNGSISSGNSDGEANDLHSLAFTLIESDLNYSIVSLLGLSAGQLAETAATNKSVLYALLELNPFALDGVDVDGFYNKLNAAKYSEQFLSDRAAMLERVIHFNTADVDASITLNFSEGMGYLSEKTESRKFVGDGLYFEDKTSGIIIDQTASNDPYHKHKTHIIFGLQDDDAELLGEKGDDRLYGLNGNDVLTGGEGNDTLEGGQGADTYVWNSDSGLLGFGASNDGSDTIIEVEGTTANILIINGIDISTLTFEKISETQYRVLQGEDWFAMMNYQSAGDLTINIVGDIPATITIKDYQLGMFDFPIELAEETSLPENDDTNHFVLDGSIDSSVTNAEVLASEFNDFSRYDVSGKSLVYDAMLYHSNSEISPIQNNDNKNILRDYQFDGESQTDWLIGDNWSVQQQAAIEGGAGSYVDERIVSFIDMNIGDILNGKDGDDYLYGDKGLDEGDNDILVGGRGSDILIGGAGNDILIGYETYWGSIQTQSVSQLENNSMLDANDGELANSDIEHLNDRDILDGGIGEDIIYGGSYQDNISGGSGRDVIYGGLGGDRIEGGSESDWIYGDSQLYINEHGALTGIWISPELDLPFFQAQDYDVNSDFNDFITGGDGDDQIKGEMGSDDIYGGEGNDRIQGDRTNTIPVEQLGSQRIYNDLIYQYAGKIYHGDDYIEGGEGIDQIDGNGGDDVIYGGADGDYIRGDDASLDGANHGKDTLYGEGGNDVIEGNGGDDTIYGGAGDDQLFGDRDDAHAIIYAGTEDQIQSLDLEFHGNDTIYGDAGDDYIDGGSGNDTIYGGEGNDTLRVTGGDGNTLDGGSGADVYVVSGSEATISWGDNDTVLSEGNTVIRLASTVNLDALTWAESGNHIVLFNDAGSSLAVDKQLATSLMLTTSGDTSFEQPVLSFITNNSDKQVFFNPANPPQFTTLADVGLVANSGGIDAQQPIIYSDVQTTEVLGTEAADMIVSLSGDHQIQSGLGDDQIMTGLGKNMIYTGTGNDVIVTSGGDNVLVLDDGSKTLQLSAGMGKNRVYFSSNDARLNLNLKNILINQLTAVEYDDLLVLYIDNSTDNYVMLSASDVSLVTINSDEGALSLSDALLNSENYWNDESHTNQPIPSNILQLSNSDVFVLDSAVFQTFEGFEISGTDEADVLNGGFLGENIEGYGGDDIITANEGNDVIAGGEGDDYIDVGRGKDEVRIESGKDTLLLKEGYGENIVILDGRYKNELALVLTLTDFERADVYSSVNLLGNTVIHINDNDSIEIRYEYVTNNVPVTLNFSDETSVQLEHFINDIYSIDDLDADGIVVGDESDNSYLDTDGLSQVLAGQGNDIVVIDAALNSISSIDVKNYDSVEHIDVTSVDNTLELIGSTDDHFINANNHSVIYQYNASDGGLDTIIGANNIIVNLSASSTEFSIMSSYLEDGLWVYDFDNENKLRVDPSANVVFKADMTDSNSLFFASAGGAVNLTPSGYSYKYSSLKQQYYIPRSAYAKLNDREGYEALIITGNTDQGDIPLYTLLTRVGDDLSIVYSNEYSDKFIESEPGSLATTQDINGNDIYREIIQGRSDFVLRQVRIEGFFGSDNETITVNESGWKTGTRVVETWVPTGGGYTQGSTGESGVIDSNYGSSMNLAGSGWELVTRYEEYTYQDEWTTSYNVGGFVENIGAIEHNISKHNLESYLEPSRAYITYDSYSKYSENTAPELYDNSFYMSYQELADTSGFELTGNKLTLFNYDGLDMWWGEDREGDLVSIANITEGENISGASFSYNNVSLGIGDLSQDISFNYQLTDGDLLSDIGHFVAFDSDGANHLVGTEFDDYIDSGANNDVITGLSGNDILIGGAGADFLTGGEGSDTYIYNTGDGSDIIVNKDNDFSYDRLEIESGHGIAGLSYTSIDEVIIYFEDGTEFFTASDNVNITLIQSFFVKDADDLIVNLASSETVRLVNYFIGDDYAVNEIVFGFSAFSEKEFSPDGDSNDWLDESLSFFAEDIISVLAPTAIDLGQTIDGSGQSDHIIASSGDDVIEGYNGADVIEGGAGNDVIDGGNGDDVIDGGEGDDTLFGGRRKDQIAGGKGDDIIEGGKGADYLMGNTGADLIGGGKGKDIIDGGEGDDTLFGGRHKDLIASGEGDDIIDGGKGADNLMGNAGADIIVGGKGKDIIDGGEGDDTLFGGRHKDQIAGGKGNDSIEGGKGADILNGGLGDDILIGGFGNDTYQYSMGDGHDIIINGNTANHNESLEMSGINAENLWFKQQGLDLVIEETVAGGSITVANWYGSNSSKLDEIHTESAALDVAMLDQLIQAMVAFDIDHADDGLVAQATQNQLDQALVESWQSVS